MQALCFNRPYDIEVREYELPRPKDDEVILKIGACGVCGTDFHIYQGEAPAMPPVVLGHEYTGEVIEAGKNVSGLKPGDHAAVNPNIHCGYCDMCRKGKINLCRNLKALGVTVNGGFSEYAAVPAAQAYYIPQSLPYKEAAFAEPLSCCVHGINQASVKIGDKVAVIGAGPIGLLMLQLIRLSGAGRVYAAEPAEAKAAMALDLGAEKVFNPMLPSFGEEFMEMTGGGADVVIECAGNENAAQQALSMTRKGGTLVIFGLASPQAVMHINLQQLFHSEITIRSSILNPNTFQTAVDLLSQGRIKTSQFSPRMIALNNEDVRQMFNRKDNSVIKYMIEPDLKTQFNNKLNTNN